MLNNRKRLFFLLALALIVGSAARAGVETRRSVMIVPARRTTMQLAFDMVRLRNVTLVSYQRVEGAGAPLLHTWDFTAGRWYEVSMEALAAGNVDRDARAVAVLGSSAEDIALFDDAIGWTDSVTRIPTLKVDDVVNALDTCYRFSAREWRWLGARYKLDLEDLNYERRKYGRYGPPHAKASRPMASQSDMFPEDKAEVIQPVAVTETISPVIDDEPESFRIRSTVVPVESVAPAREEKGIPAAVQPQVKSATPDIAPQDK